MTRKGDNFISKNLDVIIIGLMYLFWIYPVLFPFALPIEAGEKATTFYEVVEALPDEPNVLVCYDYSAVSKPLFQGLEEAAMKHIYRKNGRIIMVAFGIQGPMMYKKTLETFADVLNTKTYGEDYVFLGFIAGGETGLTSFLANIRGTISEDYEGNPIDTLPIMDNINQATDFDLILDLETDTTLGDGFVRQVSAVYGTKLALACSGGGTYEPYYPDQLQALLYPLPGVGAEYEKLMNAPGNASAQMAVLLLGNVFYLLLICLGNIVGLFERVSQ